MHIYIVFAHPSRRSFTGDVLAEFCRGLKDGGHSYEIGDLYEMDFRTDMSLDEYNREMNVYGNRPDLLVPLMYRLNTPRSRRLMAWYSYFLFGGVIARQN